MHFVWCRTFVNFLKIIILCFCLLDNMLPAALDILTPKWYAANLSLAALQVLWIPYCVPTLPIHTRVIPEHTIAIDIVSAAHKMKVV